MSISHPVFMKMLKSGCTNHNNINYAFQTYIEFCEVHDFKNVDYSYSPELDMIYIKGTQNVNEEIFLPVSIKQRISPNWIENVQNVLCKDEIKSINLVVRDADTTCATYKVTSALVPPPSPETAKKKKLESEKKRLLKKEINKNREEIYKLACEIKQ